MTESSQIHPALLVHTDITKVSEAFAVLGFFITCYGLVSYVAKERLYLSEPLIALTIGIVTGPYVLGWVDPLSWGDTTTTDYVTLQFTRLVIGVQVLFAGISLPARYLKKNALSLTVLLSVVMSCAWLTVALLIWALIPGLSFLESLCLSAAITPTDPVLAASITSGHYAEKHVPKNVRNILVAESGANDGLGFPFIYLAIYLIRRLAGGNDEGLSIGQEIGRWLYSAVIYQIVLSVVYGAVVGFVARKSLKWAEARQYIDKDNFFAHGLGLALFVLGTCGLFGSDDILACFVAGNSYTWDDFYRLKTLDNDTQDILDMLLNAAVFIYIGAIIDWKQYIPGEGNPLGLEAWRVVVLAIGVLLLRRPPWVVATTRAIPALTTVKESLFAGWFGPIGVSAIFYVQIALRDLPESSERLRAVYGPVVLFVVFASVLCHGVTVPISKLGPTILRRTATLTQTRSLTFASRQNSRANSPTEGTAAGEKAPWNPLLSLLHGIMHVTLVWRKDSFWRKPPKQKPSSNIKGKSISGPSDAQKQKTMEADRPASSDPGQQSDSRSSDGEDGSETENRKGRLPRPTFDLPLSAQDPTPSTREHSPKRLPSAAVGATGSRIGHVIRDVKDALDREVIAERKEAQDEAAAGWSSLIPTEHASGTATPLSSRNIRFEPVVETVGRQGTQFPHE